MLNAYKETAFALAEELFDEPTTTPASLRETFGILHLQLDHFGRELALAEAEQDADKHLQSLVQLAVTALQAASLHVLPVIELEVRR
jgi:hypothetical protein